MSEDTAPSVKDLFGNAVHIGDTVCFNYRPERAGLSIAKIIDIKEGGVAVAIGKNSQGVTPKQVRIIMDITLTMDPRLPAFVDIVKIVSPQADEALEKALSDAGIGPKLVQ